MIDVKDCIGKKVILKGKGCDCIDFYEVDILEFSPNKKLVKIKIRDEEKWELVRIFYPDLDIFYGTDIFYGYQIVDILGEKDEF